MSRKSIPILCLCLVILSISAAFGQLQSNPSPSTEGTLISAPLGVAATAGKGQVRFASLGLVRRMRLEVLDQAGDRIYDSDFRDGSLLDWKMEDQQSRRLPDGLYGFLVTVEDLDGLRSHRRAVFWVKEGAVLFSERERNGVRAAVSVEGQDSVTVLLGDEALPITQVAHNGKIGLVVSGKGGLSFRMGDLFAGKDVEHMRLTADGKLGLGIEEPAVKLDVTGLIRTSEGIQFPDGTIQRTAARSGVVTSIAAGTLSDSVPSAADPIAPGVSSIMQGAFTTTGGPSQAARGEKLVAAGDRIGRVNGTEGNTNTFYGLSAGLSNTTGTYNAFFGMDAGTANTTGTYDSSFGARAGIFNTTGSSNSFFGECAGEQNTTGSSNSFFGASAGFYNTTGNYNSFVGESAGFSNTVEHNNSFVGALSNGAAGITNATAVGYQAQVTRSNSIVLGSINGVNSATADTNVGIGTTSPDRLLVLEGAQALARFTRYNDTGSSFGPAYLCERARGTRAAPSDILVGDHLGKMQFRGRVSGSMVEYGAFSFVASDTKQNGRFAFFDRDIATERVSILNTGNVGIGTTAPSERLHVVGNLKVSGSILYGAPEEPFPDYVFERDYKLMPIEQLEKFIAREKHLPNIPRASEMKEKGLNLGEFQMKLLEKIEELTVYAVEQAKTIREQQSSLDRKATEVTALKSQNAALDARLAALEQSQGQQAGQLK